MDNRYEHIKQLLLATQQGDKKSYAELLDRLDDIITKFVKVRVFNDSDTQDIVQESLLAIHNGLSTYSKTQKFESWFFAIVRYKLADYFRKLSKSPNINQDYDITNAKQHDSHIFETREIIFKALNKLSPDEKQVIIWQKFEGYSNKKIASLLQKSESSVKVISHRGLKKLKSYIAGDFILLFLVTFYQFFTLLYIGV